MNTKIAKAPPKALEGAYESEEPWGLSFIQFMINPPHLGPFYKLM